MNSTTRRGLLAATLITLSCASCGGDVEGSAGQPLRFSAIPDKSLSTLKARNEVVAAYLADKLGVEVEFIPTTDYPASVEAFANGDIDFAWFGGVSGVHARRQLPGARAIAQGVVDPEYYSYFVANASTGLSLSDDFPTGLAGRKFTFGSKGSTSGRCMPEHFIRKATGKAPAEFFDPELGYSGAHDLTAQQVADGTYEAGALSYKAYDGLVADGTIDPEVCRIIWKTPTYADYNFTVRPDLDETFGEGFTQRLTDALVGCEDTAVLEALQRPEGLIAARNEDFEALAATMEAVGL